MGGGGGRARESERESRESTDRGLQTPGSGPAGVRKIRLKDCVRSVCVCACACFIGRQTSTRLHSTHFSSNFPATLRRVSPRIWKLFSWTLQTLAASCCPTPPRTLGEFSCFRQQAALQSTTKKAECVLALVLWERGNAVVTRRDVCRGGTDPDSRQKSAGLSRQGRSAIRGSGRGTGQTAAPLKGGATEALGGGLYKEKLVK